MPYEVWRDMYDTTCSNGRIECIAWLRGGEPGGAAGSATACDHRNRRHDDQTQGIGRRGWQGREERQKRTPGGEVKGVQMSSKEREEARGEGWS